MATHFVYILQSIDHPDQFCTGPTNDVQTRLAAHNAGQSPHTSKYKPRRIVSAHYFADASTAAAFELNLKTGSGRVFAAKHLR